MSNSLCVLYTLEASLNFYRESQPSSSQYLSRKVYNSNVSAKTSNFEDFLENLGFFLIFRDTMGCGQMHANYLGWYQMSSIFV